MAFLVVGSTAVGRERDFGPAISTNWGTAGESAGA